MSKNDPHILGKESIGKLLLQYSIPAIIGMTITSIYNIIDSIFIGHGVGAMAIAGLAVSFPLMNLVVAFCTLVSAGGSTLASIRLGQKDMKGATEILSHTLMLLIEIKNNGPAIPPEIAEHIFIPFFTTKERGSGIGLSISRQIMRLSGGSLTLIPDDKETKFILKFK